MRNQPNVVRTLLYRWCRNVLSSKVKPMRAVGRMIREHFEGVIAWVDSRQTNGLLAAIRSRSHLGQHAVPKRGAAWTRAIGTEPILKRPPGSEGGYRSPSSRCAAPPRARSQTRTV
jgi:hypothetical protein